jgi:hypothetical protein
MEEIIEQPALETSEIAQLEIQDGSMLGKFKDAKSLLEAYNSLESEFTRKCQKLAELQRENENYSKKITEFNLENDKYASVDDFVSGKSDMDRYKQDITEISNLDEVKNLPNKYQVAYIIAKQSESKSAKMLNDPEFLDKQVENNTKIKDKIIFDYLSKLNNSQLSPSVMSGNSTSVFFSPQVEKPKTIREAGELFSKMLY